MESDLCSASTYFAKKRKEDDLKIKKSLGLNEHNEKVYQEAVTSVFDSNSSHTYSDVEAARIAHKYFELMTK